MCVFVCVLCKCFSSSSAALCFSIVRRAATVVMLRLFSCVCVQKMCVHACFPLHVCKYVHVVVLHVRPCEHGIACVRLHEPRRVLKMGVASMFRMFGVRRDSSICCSFASVRFVSILCVWC